MDYNQMPLSLGFLAMENQTEMDRFYNMTEDEKKEYIERNRSNLSENTIDKLTASIVEDEDDALNFDQPSELFNDRSF